MEPGPLIARGRTADVYAWEPGKVLKLFQPWMDRRAVEYEQRLAQTVHAAGVFTPAVGEVISRGERWGLVYERVEATTLFQQLLRRPWQAKHLAREMAELQAAMHTCPAPDLPPMHARLEEKIRHARPLPQPLREQALGALEKLPHGQMVCHGDFHPDNILVTGQGLMVIDWIDATAGHPMGDVARSELLILHGALPPGTVMGGVLRLLRRAFYDAYIQRYFSLSTFTAEQAQPWLPVVAAARLSEGITEEEQSLIKLASSGLLAT
jgi:tRNA A-37 threonylcarbamoyl transferase component Bud32